MVEKQGLRFATNLGVLYDLKEKHGFTTLQETYGLLEKTNIDIILEVLNASYNRANSCSLDANSFATLLDEKGFGFVKLTSIFKDVIEAIMYNGLSPEELDEQKNLIKNLK